MRGLLFLVFLIGAVNAQSNACPVLPCCLITVYYHYIACGDNIYLAGVHSPGDTTYCQGLGGGVPYTNPCGPNSLYPISDVLRTSVTSNTFPVLRSAFPANKIVMTMTTFSSSNCAPTTEFISVAFWADNITYNTDALAPQGGLGGYVTGLCTPGSSTATFTHSIWGSFSNSLDTCLPGSGVYVKYSCAYGQGILPASGNAGGSSSTFACFHETTQISYKGQPPMAITKFAASNPSECVIPHSVRTDGVIIQHSCSSDPLRLTADHLVYTHRGLVYAGTLERDDVLYHTEEEVHGSCKVLEVSLEKDQTYVGLNCLHSVVIANGVKTSTFGSFHAIPAAWMKYASKIIGINWASAIGDTMVNIGCLPHKYFFG